MDARTFKEHCESVILVDELPPLSRLRQKVAGCYEVFGMCPEGEIVGLDTMGRVNCLKAEARDGASWCEEDGAPCSLEAQQSDILGVVRLLRDFVVSNFVTKDGQLPDMEARKRTEQGARPRGNVRDTMTEVEYADEDMGVSPYLAKGTKEKRR